MKHMIHNLRGVNGGKTKDYHIKSVENYIGDSGKEFEVSFCSIFVVWDCLQGLLFQGAAEQIVESYMGEYMQVDIGFALSFFIGLK